MKWDHPFCTQPIDSSSFIVSGYGERGVPPLLLREGDGSPTLVPFCEVFVARGQRFLNLLLDQSVMFTFLSILTHIFLIVPL